MNAREKLLNLWAKLWADGKLGLMEYEDKHFKIVIDFETLAQAILDAGFVRLEDVEIDEETLKLVPAISRILLDFEKTNSIRVAREMFDILIKQISQAKEILRVKEGKK